MKSLALLIFLAFLSEGEALYNSYSHVVRCSGAGSSGAITPVVGAYCSVISGMALFGAEIPRTGIPLRWWTDDGSSVTLTDNTTGVSATAAIEFESEVYTVPNSTAIWSYGQLLRMINAALATAHSKIGIGGDPIAIRLNPADKLFSFVVPNAYVGRVTLYTRWTVTRLLGSFGKNMPVAVNYPSSSPQEFMYKFGPTGETDGQKSVYTQDASSISAWSDLIDIEVTLCDQSSVPSTVVLTDYMPLPSSPGRDPYEYRGPSIWTYCPPNSAPSMSIYYRFASGTAAGERHPIMLHEGDYWRIALGYS